ncbi:MAG: S-layer homology domain-containing protein, partial [Clostridiaceae bacterium]|nr:S-layer homology domain-containing protein [Clostridiaceae bacterium]
LHIEGLWLHGEDLAEGIDIDTRKADTPLQSVMQFENVRFENSHGRPEESKSYTAAHVMHPDLIQNWGGPTYYRIDRMTGSAHYQGFMIQPIQFNALAKTEIADWRNVNLSKFGPSGYLVYKTSSGTDSILLSDVYFKPYQAGTITVFPQNDPALRQAYSGEPAGGDFVKANSTGGVGVAGMNYISPGYKESSGVLLNKSTLILSGVGSTEQLIATVTDSNIANKKIAWSVVGDSSVANVAQTGLVTVLSTGTTTIRAASIENPLVYADCTLYAYIQPTGMVISESNVNLIGIGTTKELTAQVQPVGATYQAVNWISSDPSVATVSNTGVITAVGYGSTTVRVFSVTDSVYNSMCTITVLDLADTTVPSWPKGSTLTASGTTQTGTTLIWTPANDYVGVERYKILKDEVEIGTVSGSILTYNVTGLIANSTYNFKVEAGDTAGNWSTNGPSSSVETDRKKNNNNNNPIGGTTQTTPTVTQIQDKITTTPVLDSKTGEAKTNVEAKTMTDAFTQAKADATGTKTISVEVAKVEGAKAYNTTLPASVFTATTATQRVELRTDLGNVIIPSNMLSNASLGAAREINVTISSADKSKLSDAVKAHIGTRPVIEINLTADGKKLEYNNADAPVIVSIPYKPSAEELKNPEHIIVSYIDGQGKVLSVPSGRYNAVTGMVTFTTTHFSHYAIAAVYKSFSDISDYAWAKNEIVVMASKGIINGTSEKTFVPGESITRADFTMLLVKALSLSAKIDSSFQDVSKDAYYYEAVSIAKKLGIINGQGDNKFNPSEKISRQDMVVIIARAMKVAKKVTTISTDKGLDGFKDKGNIASYALSDVALMVNEGLVKGSNEMMNPLANTTRAEAAVLMYKIYNK